jgi:hypothetical protein
MWTKADLHFSVMLGLRKGLQCLRVGMRRTLTDEQQGPASPRRSSIT